MRNLKSTLLSLVLSILVLLSTQQDIFKISTIHDKIKNGTKCLDIIDYFLNRSHTYNSKLNAIISYNPLARLEAQQLDEYYANKTKLIGKLHCIPTIVKDNIDIKGMPTTGGLNALRNSIPNQDAYVIKRLRSEGAIFIAKSNLIELAYGYSDKSETGGLCHNPFDFNKTCCTSSSGSGAATAAGLSILSLGTDTSGSITGPSSYAGIYGIRTQYNNPSVEEIIPLFDRQDTVGPITKYINDLVLSYSVMIQNETVYNEFNRTDNENPSDLKISILNLFFDSIDPDQYSSWFEYLFYKSKID